MPRRITAMISTWLRSIVIAHQNYDELTTVNIAKTQGRMLVGLGTPAEHIQEINAVIDYLIAQGLLIKDNASKSVEQYWEIEFESYTYHPTSDFQQLIEEVRSSSQQTLGPKIVNIFNGDNNQVANDSVGAVMTFHITNTEGVDEETKILLKEMRAAMNAKDASAVKRVFGYIADKSVDVAIQIALGKFYRS